MSLLIARPGRHPTRREILKAVAPAALAASFGLSCPAHTKDGRLIVVTSFPEELTTRYEQEFERAYPGAHVQFIWKQSRDALVELSKLDQGGVDVYWAPALGNFPVLRDRGALRKISVDRSVLPGRLGDEQLSDPSGTFEAYDVAGYGIAVNPGLLRDRSLPEPKSWSDLAKAVYAGQIVIPIPSKVGFSPALYDIILQSEGWDRGWALISEIAGNSELLAAGNAPVRVVKERRAPLGLTIDFFALSAQANGLPVAFVYPARTAFLPAHIAVTASTRRYEIAKAFVDFVLSKRGQKLVLETDSSRHPARPDAYEGTAPHIVDPFAAPRDAFIAYDTEIGRRRPGLVSLLFDIALAERHAEVVALWRAIHDVEQKLSKSPNSGARQQIAEARRLAGVTPVSADDATDPAFLQHFANRDVKDLALIAKWRAEFEEARARAFEFVNGIQPTP
jgi:phosphoglycerate transport regulatory protein PgtC